MSENDYAPKPIYTIYMGDVDNKGFKEMINKFYIPIVVTDMKELDVDPALYVQLTSIAFEIPNGMNVAIYEMGDDYVENVAFPNGDVKRCKVETDINNATYILDDGTAIVLNEEQDKILESLGIKKIGNATLNVK